LAFYFTERIKTDDCKFYEKRKNSLGPLTRFRKAISQCTFIYRCRTRRGIRYGNIQIVEYRKKDGKKDSIRRIVPAYEMSVEDFDVWKKKLVDDALAQHRHVDRTTRNTICMENLHETALIATESIEEQLIREEDERQTYITQMQKAKELLFKLTPTQRKRYYKSVALGKTPTEIASEEGVAQPSVFESIERAKARIEKLKSK